MIFLLLALLLCRNKKFDFRVFYFQLNSKAADEIVSQLTDQTHADDDDERLDLLQL